MTRQEQWTEIVVAKPVCAPMRSVITGALDPYGVVYRASYEYAIKAIDPRKLPKGEIERKGGLVMCYVAKIQVRERAARACCCARTGCCCCRRHTTHVTLVGWRSSPSTTCHAPGLNRAVLRRRRASQRTSNATGWPAYLVGQGS